MKEVKGFPYYKINENGIIINKSNHILRPSINNNTGRPKVHLYKYDDNGKRILPGINATVHRLVAETFIPNPDNLPQVMHLDNDVLHNHVSNLKWGTALENVQQCIYEGRRSDNVRDALYEVSDGEFITVCHGLQEVSDIINVPFNKVNVNVRLGFYDIYNIKQIHNNIIEPFHFI
jgi:hypothetical protein